MAKPCELDAYMAVIREEVCSRCRERSLGALPCGSEGLDCVIELHLPQLIDICHSTDSCLIGPYLEKFRGEICATCDMQWTEDCHCPMQALLPLAVRAIEAVDRRRNADLGGSWTE
jgi:hypothetical protein